MSLVTPTLNLNLPTVANASAGPAKAAAAPAGPAAAAPAPAKVPDTPSTTVTLSPQAQSALATMNASSHAGTPPSAPAPHDGSVYESLKNGIASAVSDVGGAIEDGAHAVVDGVETTLSTVNTAVKGLLGLPFAAVAKACDAAGAIIEAV